MATDKSAPALPKVGEVWVTIPRNRKRGYPTLYEVVAVAENGGVEADVLSSMGILMDYFTASQWRRITKRAVRVDDKERGR